VHRLFSYFITRVLMKAYIESMPEGMSPEEFATKPFYFFKVLEKYLPAA